jgi:hypothetical protein
VRDVGLAADTQSGEQDQDQCGGGERAVGGDDWDREVPLGWHTSLFWDRYSIAGRDVPSSGECGRGCRGAVRAEPASEHGESQEGDREQDDECSPGERGAANGQVDDPYNQPGGGEQEVAEDHRRGQAGGPGLLLAQTAAGDPRTQQIDAPNAVISQMIKVATFMAISSSAGAGGALVSGPASMGCTLGISAV